MTVIAYRDGLIACDSMCISGGMKSNVNKFARPANAILFGSGEQSAFLQLVSWYVGGANPADWPTSINRNDFTSMIVAQGGRIFEYEHLPYPIEIIDPYSAWGSGRDIAMGAMYMGATAEQACMAAAQHNNGCGGKIHTFKVPC